MTAYYGLFRIGELTFSEHAVRAKDVHVGTNKKKMLFVLHSSKTHDKGSKPQLIKVTSMPTFHLRKMFKYQGVKEFHMLARIGCFKNYGFQSF